MERRAGTRLSDEVETRLSDEVETRLSDEVETRLSDEVEALDCPLLQGWDGDESLLFTPSEIRTRLLQFLFCRVHRKFREKMELPSADPSTPTCDPRIRQLGAFGELLGLCDSDDVDIISGAATISRQQEFYRRLLQLIRSKEHADRAAGEDSALRSHVLASRWFTAELGAGRLLATLATGRPVTLGPPPLPESRAGGSTRGALQQGEEQLQDLQQRRDDLRRQLEEETRALTQLQLQLQQRLQSGQVASLQTVPPGGQERAAEAAATKEGAAGEEEVAQERAAQQAALQALSLALRESQRLTSAFRSLSEGELRPPAPPSVHARPPPAVRLGAVLHELHANLGLLAQAADAQQQMVSECREIHAAHDTRRSQRAALGAEFEKIKHDSISWKTALAEECGL